MSLEALFRSAVCELRSRGIVFAVAGGLAADLYRDEPRLTMDVDFAILTETAETAISVIESLGLQAGLAREADLAGGPPFAIRLKNTNPCIVVGRPAGGPGAPGIDILLPAIPWTADAVQRAQANAVDFGFGPVPALTLEDVVVATLHALQAVPMRAKDLDDLQSIFRVDHRFDTPYLAGRLQRFRIVLPRDAKPFLPDWVCRLFRT
jgi:hypothetical protein